MNSVNLIGNLTRDVQVRYVGENNTAIATLGIAVNVNRGKKEETLFVDVDVWGAQAENCSKYLSKGRKVGVTGRLKQDHWEDKETGQKRSKILVVADSVQFLSGGGTKDESVGSTETEQEQPTTEETPF